MSGYPKRVQRKRSGMPTGALYCGGPGRYANPFAGKEFSREQSLSLFREAFWAGKLYVTPDSVLQHFGGKVYLSDWCATSQQCHVDEYIEAIQIKEAEIMAEVRKRRFDRDALCPYCSHPAYKHYSVEDCRFGVLYKTAYCMECNPEEDDEVPCLTLRNRGKHAGATPAPVPEAVGFEGS